MREKNVLTTTKTLLSDVQLFDEQIIHLIYDNTAIWYYTR